MKHYLLFIILCLYAAACNVSDDGPTQTIKKICESCSEDEICFEEQCCMPATECSADQCGEVSDGCGLTLDCGVCGCFNDNFAEFCPSRPCETVKGCNDARECVYEPVSCGGSACACDEGSSCNDADLRDCRDPAALVCPADFCDPSPTMENGAVVFQNQCTQPEGANCDFSNLCAAGTCAGDACVEAECGICNLGVWECAEMTTNATCFNIPTPIADPEAINCNSNSASSSFIYLDHIDGLDENGSGTRDQPFFTLEAAVTAAKQRGANGIIIRSGLIQITPLIVENGISLYGGFSGAPNWKYDGGAFTVAVSATDPDGNVIGALAHDITDRTVLFRVHIRTNQADAQKSSSYGIHALNAPALILQEVEVDAGKGSTGSIGADGARGTSGSNGQRGIARGFGAGGVNPDCPIANGARGGLGGKRGNFSGGRGDATPRGLIGGGGGQSGSAGLPGSRFPTVAADGSPGLGGQHTYNLLTNFYTPTGDGAPGIDGDDGAGGSGGGGSGGLEINFNNLRFEGGGGGGGTAGGCGGKAGQPGLAGGGSFGIFALNSTGLEIIKSSITSGNAGDGGAGGIGGKGGSPAAPGPGAVTEFGVAGGVGGTGRSGGDGAYGGGGAGGATYALFCENTQVTPIETTLEHGSEGTGGAAPEAGANGTAGPSFNCEIIE